MVSPSLRSSFALQLSPSSHRDIALQSATAEAGSATRRQVGIQGKATAVYLRAGIHKPTHAGQPNSTPDGAGLSRILPRVPAFPGHRLAGQDVVASAWALALRSFVQATAWTGS